jgi:hypothetical protein
MDNYKSNSHRSKAEQKEQSAVEKKKVSKVVTGNVKTKKSLYNVIFAEDIRSVGNDIVTDVVIPFVKKVFVDSICEGAHKLFLGDSARRSSTPASRIGYSSIYDSRSGYSTKPSESRSRTVFDYENIVIDDRTEAEEVLVRMDELIETYGWASVADLYDLVGMTCEHTDNNYGWSSLHNAEVVRLIGGGYRFKMPKALPIKK